MKRIRLVSTINPYLKTSKILKIKDDLTVQVLVNTNTLKATIIDITYNTELGEYQATSMPQLQKKLKKGLIDLGLKMDPEAREQGTGK